MTHAPLGRGSRFRIATEESDGTERSAQAISDEIRLLPARAPFELISSVPLEEQRAAAIFRALAGQDRPFSTRLRLAAIRHKAVLEEAAHAGCAAIEFEREGPLVAALSSSLAEPPPIDLKRTIQALRRARGLGMATVAHLQVGAPGDDESVFERVVRLCRSALVAVPVITACEPGSIDGPGAGGAEAFPSMDQGSLENGLRWTRQRLASHAAIWRRSLWPAGSRLLALRAGYRQRLDARETPGSYTRTMHLLRSLNRTKRARPRARVLSTLASDSTAAMTDIARGMWLRVRAASNAQGRTLFIQVEGALDRRGASSLLERVREALQVGYQRITIDFRGLEWVSLDVLTRFLEENRTRLLEVSQRTRLLNLRGVVEALRRQLGDSESLRLIEAAADHA